MQFSNSGFIFSRESGYISAHSFFGSPCNSFLESRDGGTGAGGRPPRFWQIRKPYINRGTDYVPHISTRPCRFSDLPTFLESMKCEMNVFFASPLICRQRGMQTDKYMRQKDEFIFLARPDSHCVHFKNIFQSCKPGASMAHIFSISLLNHVIYLRNWETVYFSI